LAFEAVILRAPQFSVVMLSLPMKGAVADLEVHGCGGGHEGIALIDHHLAR